MTTFLHPVVEGETEEIIHQLLSDGDPFPIQGLNIVLVLQKPDGTPIDTSTKITNLDDGTLPNRGKVKLSPDAADWVRTGSGYYWRWVITDGAGKIVAWPGGDAPRMKVYPVAKP